MSHVVRRAIGPIFKNNPRVLIKGLTLCGGVKPIDDDSAGNRGHHKCKNHKKSYINV